MFAEGGMGLSEGDRSLTAMERGLGQVHLIPGAPVAIDPDHPPLVAVVWTDAWFDLELGSLDEAREDYAVRTVGFLLRDGGVVTLAQEVLPDGDGFRAVTHIPRGMVLSIDPL